MLNLKFRIYICDLVFGNVYTVLVFLRYYIRIDIHADIYFLLDFKEERVIVRSQRYLSYNGKQPMCSVE